ncbi:MAG: hypothetical protein L6V92_11140 [Phocaeicola vulgatus]|nr:MAG: hypothetical protein L6V92_11140 [Phocaeicola vulgatus]
MKKLSYYLTAAFSAVTLLTSCLGESTNVTDITISGIVFSNPAAGLKTMIDAGSAYVYVPNLLQVGNYPENTCLGANIHIDYNSAENANWGTSGYLTATLNSDPQVFSQWRATPITSAADTTGMIENEIPLTFAFQQSAFSNYVRGWMIFASGAKIGSKQNVEWTMKYPQELKVEELNGKRCYNFYIRATASGDNTGASGQSVINGWYVKTALDRIDATEKAAGNQSYYLKFNYVTSIDANTNKLTWKSDLAQMAVSSNTNNKQ